jgi:dihydrofolate synthase / folylpolyglutamate synthase
MDFQESLEYLQNLGNEVLAMKLGLTSTEKMLAALGNPERKFLKIQVAGTNGKGSTCAFLDAICRSAKIKTGLFTSPHLISITERIKIDGKEISEADFARYATRIREIAEKLVAENELEAVPTFFEQITALAISVFAEARVELAILETGLGGRFDSVTATRAEIVAITPVDYDHQQILGNSLTKIAGEKAAIIRRDTKVVLAEQLKAAEKIVSGICANLGVTPKLAREVTINETSARPISNLKSQISNDATQIALNFKTQKTKYENIQLGLRGRHQIENAKVAILLAEILQEANFNIANNNVVEGLKNAKHKGRLEFYRGILFDGAHNVAGAKALKNYLDEFIQQPITMIFGTMRDKDIEEIAAILFPKAKNLILTKVDNPRSANMVNWLGLVTLEFFEGEVFYADNVRDAYKTAKKLSVDEGLICITGSLYLIGEAQRVLFEE